MSVLIDSNMKKIAHLPAALCQGGGGIIRPFMDPGPIEGGNGGCDGNGGNGGGGTAVGYGDEVGGGTGGGGGIIPGVDGGGGGAIIGGGGIICMGICIDGTGASANSWCGRSACDRGFCAASKRSAAEPCRSPFESFLNAYDTDMGLLQRYCPFIASIAASEASKLAKFIKAKPFELPVSGSRIICISER